MNTEIELYKGPERMYFGSLSVAMLLVEALRELTGEDLLRADSSGLPRQTRIVLHLRDDPDVEPRSTGLLHLVNLSDAQGGLDVEIAVDNRVVHAGRYSVGELFGPVLIRTLQRLDPDEREWAYTFRGLGGESGNRPLPNVAGTVDVDLRRPPRNLPFTVHPVEASQGEVVVPTELGIDPSRLGSLNVLITGKVHDLMMKRLPLSDRIEEGGFLLGSIRPLADDTNRRFAEIMHVTPATRAGASAIHFTFTADSFQEVNQLLDKRDRGEDLVGWYHTHLFSPGSHLGTGTGLSSIDIETHLATFRRNGQVAGLINFFDGRRVLRFYGRIEGEVAECPLWIGDERGRYRLARPGLGSE